DAPDAEDDAIETQEDQTVSFNIGSNDTDTENDNLNYSLISAAGLGIAELTANGSLTYTPAANAFGIELLVVQVCDAFNACSTSTTTITIQSVNDLPIVQSAEITGDEDGVLVSNLSLLASDIEDGQLQFEITGIIEHGEWVLNGNSSFEFIPEPNYFGTQSVDFTVCDSEGGCVTNQFTITVHAVNDLPVAQNSTITLSEDSATQDSFNALVSDVDGDNLSIDILQNVLHGSFVLNANGSYAYAPTANYFGMDSLVYQVCDSNGACAQGTLYFEVTFLNDLPIVNNESVQIIMNTTVNGSVATNDEELDFEPLVYSIVDDFSGGTFILNPDGTYNYTPATGASGLFTVSYSACDPCNACDFGTITFFVVSIEEANTAP
ncbi:MAG: Ig-like domain-containing protein, partial [Flavobacteriales bacterium]